VLKRLATASITLISYSISWLVSWRLLSSASTNPSASSAICIKGKGGIPASFYMEQHNPRKLRLAEAFGTAFASFFSEVPPLETWSCISRRQVAPIGESATDEIS
jgi:hypothetical protein